MAERVIPDRAVADAKAHVLYSETRWRMAASDRDAELRTATREHLIADIACFAATAIIEDAETVERERIALCAKALTVTLQRPALGVAQAEVVDVVPAVSLARILAGGCIDTCDPDCENGPVHCTWIHVPNHKPGWHSAGDCPARTAGAHPPDTTPGP